MLPYTCYILANIKFLWKTFKNGVKLIKSKLAAKTILNSIKRGFNILLNPNREFSKLNNRIFEHIVRDYMWLLVVMGGVAVIIKFIISIIKAVYLDLFVSIDINYGRMANFVLGNASSIFFLYLFLGTFLVFFLSLILNPFFKKIKYMGILKILFYSLTPFLLFGWLPFNLTPIAIWCIFLFILGIKSYNSTEIKKNSIQNRD